MKIFSEKTTAQKIKELRESNEKLRLENEALRDRANTLKRDNNRSLKQ